MSACRVECRTDRGTYQRLKESALEAVNKKGIEVDRKEIKISKKKRKEQKKSRQRHDSRARLKWCQGVDMNYVDGRLNLEGEVEGRPHLRLIVFYHRNSSALLAETPHGPLAVESRGTSNTKLRYLRTAGTRRGVRRMEK